MFKVKVGKKILSENEKYALKNKQLLSESRTLCLNMISSPGSGKTTILCRTINELKNELGIGVVEGDIATDLDAERIRSATADVVQINTHGACHLSAAGINNALHKLPVADLDLIFIENVGNLVCPSAFELGENFKIAVLSVPEGDDKPAKYPAVFAKSKVLLINKTDLLGPIDKQQFDIETVKSRTRKLNKDIRIFPVSAQTGQGMTDWYDWLKDAVKINKQ